MGLRATRRDTHFFRAVKSDRADVAGFQLVGAHDFLLRFDQGGLVPGHRHAIDVRRIEQPFGVFLHAENGGAGDCLVGAHALEYGQAIMQRMGQHVGIGFTPGYEFPVVPDEAVTVGHGHNQSPAIC